MAVRNRNPGLYAIPGVATALREVNLLPAALHCPCLACDHGVRCPRHSRSAGREFAGLSSPFVSPSHSGSVRVSCPTMIEEPDFIPLGKRFRGFLPVVIDIESGGFNPQTDALLEIAAVLLRADAKGFLYQDKTMSMHVQPFEGANLEPASLEVNGIDPWHPLRIARPEKDALQQIFKKVRKAMRENLCQRAILVGHNACFDLNFLNAAIARTEIKNNPFHPFSSLDTVTLGAVVYGQTVLARIAQAAKISWDRSEAHSAIYDAGKTAELFCKVVNRWHTLDA
jgi:ribonuclease T